MSGRDMPMPCAECQTGFYALPGSKQCLLCDDSCLQCDPALGCTSCPLPTVPTYLGTCSSAAAQPRLASIHSHASACFSDVP